MFTDCLQIKRGLNYSQTGELIVPKRPLGDFSKSNWGDHVEYREGQQVTVNSTSNLTKVVDKLSPAKWDKIVTTALDASAIRENSKTTPDGDADQPADEDFELVDHDDDW
jgi:hypothetical protein